MPTYQELHSRALSISSKIETIKDQYADGKAAGIYNLLIGDSNQRTKYYKDFLIGMLKKNNCKNILDAACGTGIDSIMLIDEGFKVVSVDASDKMLKYALKARWDMRQNSKYDQWVIEEANWETLPQDIETFLPDTQFDAVICLGNSFAHLLDEYGDQRMQKLCLSNFAKCLKPGGLLFIDHRNYEAIVNSGTTPGHTFYFNSKHPVDINTSVLVVRGEPVLVILDYCVYPSDDGELKEAREFSLRYYPHKLSTFTSMLDEAFDNRARHHIYGDFQPLDKVPVPAFYIHVMQKAKN
ncbi:glycine N-methyltransferase [Bombyx mori]|uniref:Glycine N-methyltransferase n=1 Tax=Bombyx mori TaxID=7091 RepID=A0A8R2HQZ2_BOMMO|nr:glycine N-methyltransferase [Bombyx mori]